MPPTKYDDESHRKERLKLRKWRARNRAKLQQQSDHTRLARGPQQRAAGEWRLYERDELHGDAADVLLIRADAEPPRGYAVSEWLPTSVLPFHLARSLRATRRRQIAEWLAARVQ